VAEVACGLMIATSARSRSSCAAPES
jgi:hypothetical protein